MCLGVRRVMLGNPVQYMFAVLKIWLIYEKREGIFPRYTHTVYFLRFADRASQYIYLSI